MTERDARLKPGAPVFGGRYEQRATTSTHRAAVKLLFINASKTTQIPTN
jgi:hypothetical protein